MGSTEFDMNVIEPVRLGPLDDHGYNRFIGRFEDKVLDDANDMPVGIPRVFVDDLANRVFKTHRLHRRFVEHRSIGIRGKMLNIDIPSRYQLQARCFDNPAIFIEIVERGVIFRRHPLPAGASDAIGLRQGAACFSDCRCYPLTQQIFLDELVIFFHIPSQSDVDQRTLVITGLPRLGILYLLSDDERTNDQNDRKGKLQNDQRLSWCNQRT
jgi:hypothetical protein